MPNANCSIGCISEAFNIGGWCSGIAVKYNGHNSNGTPPSIDTSGAGAFDIYLNRASSQYQSISEVRVKSVISSGYIRIF